MKHMMSVALVLGACGSAPTAVTLESGSTITFAPAAVATFQLWGHDRNLADASATLIDTYAIEVAAIPATFDIAVPDDAHELIDQGQGAVAKESASFYFTMDVDVNADGQICPGDYSQDYATTELAFFDGAPPSSVVVRLKLNDTSYTCEPVPAS